MSDFRPLAGSRERGWWDAYKEDVSPQYLNYVGFEAGAAFIRQFQIGVIPGLLQTAEYAEVVTTVGPLDRSKAQPNIAFRQRRQLELRQRSAPPRQYHVLDEGVILSACRDQEGSHHHADSTP